MHTPIWAHVLPCTHTHATEAHAHRTHSCLQDQLVLELRRTIDALRTENRQLSGAVSTPPSAGSAQGRMLGAWCWRVHVLFLAGAEWDAGIPFLSGDVTHGGSPCGKACPGSSLGLQRRQPQGTDASDCCSSPDQSIKPSCPSPCHALSSCSCVLVDVLVQCFLTISSHAKRCKAVRCNLQHLCPQCAQHHVPILTIQ